MPKGPRGEKRPADVIGKAVRLRRATIISDVPASRRAMPNGRRRNPARINEGIFSTIRLSPYC
jgi:hypothetical protein